MSEGRDSVPDTVASKAGGRDIGRAERRTDRAESDPLGCSAGIGFLKENKDIFAKMDAELRKKLNIGAVKTDVPEVPANGAAEAKEAVRPRQG